MAKILGNFPAFSTMIFDRQQNSIGTSTKLGSRLTFMAPGSKLIISQNEGGVTMEADTSGSIPGDRTLGAMARP